MGKARCKAQALGSGRGQEAVERCDARRLEGLYGSTKGIIVALRRRNAERNQAGGGLMLEAARHEVEGLLDNPQAIAHQRFARFTPRAVAHCRVLMGSLVEDVAHPAFLQHASHQPEMI